MQSLRSVVQEDLRSVSDMGKAIRLEDLSKTVLIEQLKLCWKHFAACSQALSGDTDVQPVELIECDELGNGEDLELFYRCRKNAEELTYLDNLCKENNIE